MDRPRNRPGRRRDPAAAGKILRAAAEVLLERGFERMTIDDIAERAGVGKATVYRRWRSKDALAYDAVATLLDVKIPTPDTGSIEGDLAQAYAEVIGSLCTDTGAGVLRLLAAESARSPRIGKRYRHAVQHRIETTLAILQQAVTRGEVRGDINLTAVAEAVLGVVVLRALTSVPMPTADDLHLMVDLTMDGIRAR